jgi:MSHA biogenesis protein MshJ
MGALKQHWKVWSMRLDALSFRERMLVFLAVAGVTLSLMFVGLIEPALKRQELMVTRVSDLQREVFSLREQLASGEQQNQSGKNSEINRLRAEAAVLERTVKDRENGMIPPDKMISALKALLAEQAGLTLISLHTEAPRPVQKDAAGVAANETPQAETVPPAEQLYKHGVVLHVQGSYAHLTDYVQRLESLPWAMQWESMNLDAGHHPQLELTLRLSTLGREPTWARF